MKRCKPEVASFNDISLLCFSQKGSSSEEDQKTEWPEIQRIGICGPAETGAIQMLLSELEIWDEIQPVKIGRRTYICDMKYRTSLEWKGGWNGGRIVHLCAAKKSKNLWEDKTRRDRFYGLLVFITLVQILLSSKWCQKSLQVTRGKNLTNYIWHYKPWLILGCLYDCM